MPFVGNNNVSLADVNSLYEVANPGGNPPYNNTSLFDLSRYNYFEGPNGNNTITYNGWGRGGGGADRIFGLNPSNGNYSMGDYRNLYYFCEGINSNVRIDYVVNNDITPTPPPVPPNNYDIQNCVLLLWDSTKTYNYISGNSGVLGPNTSTGLVTISTTSTPIFALAYWELNITTDPFFLGGNVSLDINGTSIFTNQSVNTGNTIYDWQSFSPGLANGSGIYVTVTFN